MIIMKKKIIAMIVNENEHKEFSKEAKNQKISKSNKLRTLSGYPILPRKKRETKK